MPLWTVAAAQYASAYRSVAENIAHHLRFIAAAAELACDVLVFPELSLTGPGVARLPTPPDDRLLRLLADAATRNRITVIAGLPVIARAGWVKGVAIFVPGAREPLKHSQGQGACLAPAAPARISVMSAADAGHELDPAALLLATGSGSDERQQQTVAPLQFFAHRYAIAVLKASPSSGGSALWDEKGQLIVRADRGELLVTGQKHDRGWRGDIIPLGRATRSIDAARVRA